MRRRRSAVLLFTVLALGARTMAHTSTPPTPIESVVTTVKVSGTIKAYDTSTRVLTLSTEKGPIQFSLPTGARIRLGGRRIDASALRDLAGYVADVRYSDSGTARVVESVHVLDRGPTRPPE